MVNWIIFLNWSLTMGGIYSSWFDVERNSYLTHGLHQLQSYLNKKGDSKCWFKCGFWFRTKLLLCLFPPPDWKNRSAFCCRRSSSPHVLLSGCGGRRNRYPDLMWPNPGMCWSVYRRRAWSRRPLWELGREQFGAGVGRWGPGAIFTFRKGDREWWVFSLIVLSLFGMFCLLFQAVLVIKEQ